jgi:predicted phage tail protein
MTWNYIPSTNVFQVQYGPTGFAIGHGDSATVNTTEYRGGVFTGGVTYDFIVRAKCTDGTWSAWSSRQSFYAATNINKCTAPSNITFQDLGTGHVEFYWNGNGEGTWEYNMSNSSTATPTTWTTTTSSQAQLIGIPSGVTFYFWVRAVCSSGSKTAWTSIPFMI